MVLERSSIALSPAVADLWRGKQQGAAARSEGVVATGEPPQAAPLAAQPALASIDILLGLTSDELKMVLRSCPEVATGIAA